jgi:hypothetical protein
MWRPAEASAGHHPDTEARPLLLFNTRTHTPPASDLPRHGGLAASSELFGGGRPKRARLDLKEAGPEQRPEMHGSGSCAARRSTRGRGRCERAFGMGGGILHRPPLSIERK